MKPCIILILLTGIMMLHHSCKKTTDADDSPSCPVSNSLPTRVDYTSGSGFSATKEYTYDALNRVIQITNYDSIYTLNITYKDLDTVVYTSYSSDGGRYIAQRIFNSGGEYLRADISFFNKNGDTSNMASFYYGYDSLHQLQTMHTNQTGYLNGKAQNPNPPDSSSYQWSGGNLIQISGTVALHSMLYEYAPNTNGQFEFNAPQENSPHLYTTITRPVLSKNLVLKYTNGNGNVTIYSYDFDPSGRVKTLRNTGNISNNPAGGTYTFHYKCI